MRNIICEFVKVFKILKNQAKAYKSELKITFVNLKKDKITKIP